MRKQNSMTSSCLIDCYPEGCAAPGSVPCQCNTWGSLSKLKRTPPHRKINVTSKSPVGDISVVTLIRTDTTLDHSQKAEKVWQFGLRKPSPLVLNDAAGRHDPGREKKVALLNGTDK